MDAWVIGLTVGGVALLALVRVLVKYVRIALNIFLDVPVNGSPSPGELLGERVWFRGLDGVALSGIFLPAQGGRSAARGTVVFCHEFGSDGSSLTDYGWFLRERGFHVFTFDFRGHGRSSNTKRYEPRQWPTRFEVMDILGAVAYVRSRPEVGKEPVGLFGISRGGAAALCAAAASPVVAAVIADGAFCTRLTLHTYMRRWIGIFSNLELFHRNLPDWVYALARRVVMALAQARLRCRFPAVLRLVRKVSPRAVFLIHGARDTHIDPAQAEAIFAEAREPKRLWIVPGARHNQSVKHCPGAYQVRVTEFFSTYLSPAAGLAGAQAVAVATVGEM